MKCLNIFTLILTAIFIMAVSFKKGSEDDAYAFPSLLFFPSMPVAANNPVTNKGVELGRYLFYDPILSADSNMACGSCHKQEAAFSDAPKSFSTGRNGVLLERNTPPLFNLAWYPLLFWDGRAVSIEEQVFHPVRAHHEMNLQWNIATNKIKNSRFYKAKFQEVFGTQTIDSILIAKAIAQFERTIISYRSKYDLVLAGKAYFTKDEFEGFELANDMTKGDCLHCHSTDADALGTIPGFSNNGLDAIADVNNFKDKGRGAITGNTYDNGKFKVPTLRNIALTPPYMHDGRFNTIEDVLNFYSEGVKRSATIDSKMEFVHTGGAHLTQIEKKKIIAFLLTMTDSVLISDKKYSNPFR